MGKFMPRARMHLPLIYKNKGYFSSRYITLTSVLLLTIILSGSVYTMTYIGTIADMMKYEVLFQSNS